MSDLPDLQVDPYPVVKKLLENYRYKHLDTHGRFVDGGGDFSRWREEPVNRTDSMRLLRVGDCLDKAVFLQQNIPGIRLLARHMLSTDGKDIHGVHIMPIYKYKGKIYKAKPHKFDDTGKEIIPAGFSTLDEFMDDDFEHAMFSPSKASYGWLDRVPASAKTIGDVYDHIFKKGPLKVLQR